LDDWDPLFAVPEGVIAFWTPIAGEVELGPDNEFDREPCFLLILIEGLDSDNERWLITC
jgi:hypothetical protein